MLAAPTEFALKFVSLPVVLVDLCTCADGYMGANCQVDIDECAQNDPCGVSQSQGHRSEGVPFVNCLC